MKYLNLAFFLMACMATTCFCGPLIPSGGDLAVPNLQCSDRVLAAKGKLYIIGGLDLPDVGALLKIKLDVCLLDFNDPLYVVVFAKVDGLLKVKLTIKVDKSLVVDGILELLLAEPLIGGPDLVLGLILKDGGRLPFIKSPSLGLLGVVADLLWALLPPRLEVYVSLGIVDVDLLVKDYTIDLTAFIHLDAVYAPGSFFLCGIGPCWDLGSLIGWYSKHGYGS